LALAEQALEIAQSGGLAALAQQIEPILAGIRSQASGDQMVDPMAEATK